jgi:hypothetical protein
MRIAGLFLVGSLVGCGVVQLHTTRWGGGSSDDDFNARLSAGCNTRNECLDLVEIAETRRNACKPNCEEGQENVAKARAIAEAAAQRAAATAAAQTPPAPTPEQEEQQRQTAREEERRIEQRVALAASRNTVPRAGVATLSGDRSEWLVSYCNESRDARRQQRIADFNASVTAAAQSNKDAAENARLREYQRAHCHKTIATDYERVPCDDGSDVVKICNRPIMSYAVYECPSSAPKAIRGRQMPIPDDNAHAPRSAMVLERSSPPELCAALDAEAAEAATHEDAGAPASVAAPEAAGVDASTPLLRRK